MKVFFFGAGASKACGMPMASELLNALYSPLIYFGIDIRLSNHQSIKDKFKEDRELCMLFTEFTRKNRPINYDLLGEIFTTIESWNVENISILEALKAANVEIENLHYETKKAIIFNRLKTLHKVRIQRAFMGTFSSILNPAYHLSCNPGSYYEFVKWTKTLPDWTVILSTNWDYLLDTCINIQYGVFDEIDEGMVDLQSDTLIPQRMLEKNVYGKSVSLFKLNGSLNWLYCPKDKKFYGTLFQQPYNLNAMAQWQAGKMQLAQLDKSITKIPDNWIPGNCPNCGTLLETKVYTPGISRSTFPIAERMLNNTLFAVEHCDELTFIGFSCPKEDKDVIQQIGKALQKNSLYKSGKLIPTVIDVPGDHASDMIQRYKEALGTDINYSDIGFEGWVESLEPE